DAQAVREAARGDLILPPPPELGAKPRRHREVQRGGLRTGRDGMGVDRQLLSHVFEPAPPSHRRRKDDGAAWIKRAGEKEAAAPSVLGEISLPWIGYPLEGLEAGDELNPLSGLKCGRGLGGIEADPKARRRSWPVN